VKSSDVIAQIKSAVDIRTVAARYTELNRSGKTWKGNCPIHAERTPSFTLYQDRFYCFGCRKHGDVIQLVQDVEHVDFWSAIEILAAIGGVDVDSPQLATSTREAEILRQASQFYEEKLNTSDAQFARDYLQRRGYQREQLRDFHLGYSPDTFDGLLTALTSRGYEESLTDSTGLTATKNGKRYDRFRGRLMFPICASSHAVIGFGARTLVDGNGAKYINTPTTNKFSKGRVLYGRHLAQSHINKQGQVIVVEGYLDTVAMHLAGHQQTVGLMGTALTKHHVNTLAHLGTDVYLALDNDSAGETATRQAIAQLFPYTSAVYIVNLNGSKDPDQFLADHGDMSRSIHNATPGFTYILTAFINRYGVASASAKARICRLMSKYIRVVPSQVEQTELITELSDTLRVRDTDIRAELNGKHPRTILPPRIESSETTVLKTLLSAITALNGPLPLETGCRIHSAIKNVSRQSEALSTAIATVVSGAEPTPESLAIIIQQASVVSGEPVVQIERSLNQLKRIELDANISALAQRISNANDPEAKQTLRGEYLALITERNELPKT